jgi:nucleoside-diphosphate-sugar epimerase
MSRASELLRGRHVIVTGATGFVGSAFVRFAIASGAKVTVISRARADHWRLATVAGRYTTVECAVDNLASASVPGSTDATFVHCAAAGVNQTSRDVAELAATNVAGTVNALLCAERHGCMRFVLLGSSGEYGPGVALTEDAPLRPTSEYGASRASASMLARAFGARRGLDVVIVRPFAVFGPYEAQYRLIPHVIVRALRDEPINISSGEQTRDYIHVDDVCDGIARASVLPAACGGTFNLCTGVETSVRDVAAQIARLTNSTSLVHAGAVPSIPGEMWRTSGDPQRARAVLQWQPTQDLTRHLVDTISWFRTTGLSLPAYAAAIA